MRVIDIFETVVIVAALITLNIALIWGGLSESAYTGLMGTFLGYTFGRIFNHYQGKE